MIVTASAPGKTILFGEHFVVYGEPAIVIAIDRDVKVTAERRDDSNLHISSNLGFSGTFIGERFETEEGDGSEKTLEPIKITAETLFQTLKKKCGLNITIKSNIPIAVGLGSSGALAVATVAAIGRLLGANLTREEIVKLSFESEKYVHLNPSGIDQTISTYGGVIVYSKSEGISHMKIESSIPIVIGNTRIQRNTGRLVDSVRIRKETFPQLMTQLTQTAGQLTREAISVLKKGDLKQLGELMDINQGLLVSAGVSSEELDRLINVAKKGGALGAKLTGAGGGGCIIALSKIGKRKEIAEAIRTAGGIPLIAEKTDEGVTTWTS
ncbi:MAG: Mevalonate kinase [Thermoproteota archaeon]|nr:Mevalonate kinase [Thermoproteota archaeon]